MNTWLVGFAVEIDATEIMTYMLIQAESPAMAEAGAMRMGCTWWPECQKDDNGHRWIYSVGIIWFNSIVLLDDIDVAVLRGLKFLDAWTVTGAPDAPVLRDEWGNDWRDITR